jgi:ribokinase
MKKMNNGDKRARVVVVGSLVYDLVARVDQRPGKGETRLGTDFGMFPGGKGANQAVQAARMGAEVVMVGRVGQDMFGKEMLNSLRQHGVDTRFVGEDPDTTTAVGCITVDATGDNSIVVVPQANMKLREEDAVKALETLEGSWVLLLQLEIPLAVNLRAARIARDKGWIVILNPAPAQPLPDELLALADYLTPNEIELSMLVGRPLHKEEDILQGARGLLRNGVRGVIVTLGDAGALLVTEAHHLQIPAYLVKAVDTTAAGDAFTGALAVALAEGVPLEEAVLLANAAGGLAVTRPGAQPSLALRQDIEALMNEAVTKM